MFDSNHHLSDQQAEVARKILNAIAVNHRRLAKIKETAEQLERQTNMGEEEGFQISGGKEKEEKEEEKEKEKEKETNCERFFLITGSAGTGKSTLLRALLTQIQQAKYKSLVGSAMAVAASLCNGQTMHHTFRINIYANYAVPVECEAKTCELSAAYFADLDVFFLEEFSTCSNYILSLADERMRNFFKSDETFGGRVVVFIGDLLQLKPPIPDKGEVLKHRGQIVNLGLCVDSETWRDCVDEGLTAIELEENFRQGGDNDYARDLNKIRCAHLTRDVCKKLLSRVLLIDPSEFDWPGGVLPTFLFGTLAQVAAANKLCYDKLAGEVVEIIATIWPNEYKAQEIIKRSNVEPRFGLKVGCQVMLRANVSVANGLCNGTRGVVIGFLWENEIEERKNSGNNNLVGVRIRLANGNEQLITPHNFSSYEKGELVAQFTQIPLCLAWSMTIHKSQGLTISPLLVDIGQTCFAPSQVYVALSRTVSWDSLYLRNVDFSAIKIDWYVSETIKTLMPDSQTARMLTEPSDMPSNFQELYDFDNLVAACKCIVVKGRIRECRCDPPIPSRRKMIGKSEDSCFWIDEREFVGPHVCSFTFQNSKNIIGVLDRQLLSAASPFWTGDVEKGEVIKVSFSRAPFLCTLVYQFDIDEKEKDDEDSKSIFYFFLFFYFLNYMFSSLQRRQTPKNFQ